MFKNLREKITTTDSNSRKKLPSNNNDSTENDSANESLKNTGFQSLSRFSSISSLVNDVSSAFSKTLTAPQHVQPSLFDNESISEYDDSVVGGDILSKDELFQRFQRARLLAKRYKTRYLEVAEAYKKLELDNSKMSQALTDSQDKQICRINELKEQIELDKKAKTDVEENYMLMIEEKTELVNVLKLQISLLKEGKDLPPELEQQIKQKHEIQMQIERKKEEEIKDLKQVLAQRDNLLHRCKEKINSLNSKLSEQEMKFSNLSQVSISSEDSAKPDEKLSKSESEIVTKFNEKYEELKLQEQTMKENLKLMSEENERLIEQLDIKTKIVHDLIQDSSKSIDDYYYDAEKLKQCYLIVQKYPTNVHPIINELSSLFNFSEGTSILENAFGERDEQIFDAESNESSQVKDLQDENRFLLSRIEQLENMKILCEEENHNREKELKQSNSIIEDERKNYVLRSNSMNGEIHNLKTENEQLILINEETANKLSEVQFLLSKCENDLKKIFQENEILLKNNQLLEQNLLNIEFEKSKLIQGSQNLCDDFNNLEVKFANTQKEYENIQLNLSEKKDECKLLNDRIDELMESVNQINTEKNELLLEIKSVHIDTSTQEQISLNNLEMQQRFEQEIIELKEQIISDNKLQQEKSAEIGNLKQEIDLFRNNNENLNRDIEEATLKNSNLVKENDNLLKEFERFTENKQLMESKLEILTQESDEKEKQKIELSEKIEKQNQIVTNYQEQVEIMQLENHQLIEKNSQISEKCEKLIANLNEKSQMLENEIKEKILISNKLNILDAVQSELDENVQKQKILTEENISLKDILERYKENESKPIPLENENVNEVKFKDEYIFSKKLELIKAEINSLLQRTIKDKDVLQHLNEEISKLATNTHSMENQIPKLESTLSFSDNEEFVNENQIELIKELRKKIEEYLKTICFHEEKINTLQNLIEDKTVQLNEEIRTKDEYANTVKLMEFYLPKFCEKINDLINIGINNDNFSPRIDVVPWNIEMESDCSNCNILVATGKAIDSLLFMSHQLHSSLHESRKATTDTINLQIETQKTVDRITNEVSEIFNLINTNTDIPNQDLVAKLDAIKKALKSLSDEKTDILANIGILYSLLTEEHTKLDITVLNTIPSESPLNDLAKRLTDTLLNFKGDLSMKHELNTKLRAEYEILEGKVEKSNSLLLKLFRQLINIFRFTDINISHVADINKSSKQSLIKALKEYVKTHEQLKNEANQLKTQLTDTKNELKAVIEININIDKELEDLRTSVANDRDRLIATGEELESSMRQLNAVVDEKGRIDEEKQSLRKELKELNENIASLKLEFENQSSEKQRLEIQFDESLEKVKSNHLALEEMYRKELEKGHGYQRNLEEQIATTKESSSRMISENEKKLEIVLNQSEQLLELNYQYKKLLDEAKIENSNVLSTCTMYEKETSELQARIKQLDLENEQYCSSMNDINNTLKETDAERDSLESENRNLKEIVNNLESKHVTTNEESDNLKLQLEEVKSANLDLHGQIQTLKDSHKIILEKEKLIAEKNLELVAKYEADLKVFREQLDNSELNCREKDKEKRELQSQLNTLQTTCTRLGTQNCENEKQIEIYKSQIADLNLKTELNLCSIGNEKKELQMQLSKLQSSSAILETRNLENERRIETYKTRIEELKLEMERIKIQNENDIDELKQQFIEEKSNIEDNYHRKIKKLAKEFNDQTCEKEKDFQKTFEEALSSIRTDESRSRNDLKSTIDELNRSVIELEFERNQLLDTISDNGITTKKLANQIESNERDLESFKLKIENLINTITKLEKENEERNSKKVSKMNQTVDSIQFYEEPRTDGISSKDHEVLLMHCTDIEEQLKQLQSENIELKKSSFVLKSDHLSTNPSMAQENVFSAQRVNHLNRQPSGSNEISKSGILFQGGSFRSPNTSCSDYPFCPVPITEATDYEYLHDVLLKYMTGLETEILAKVVCTVMKFSHEETNRVLLFEQDRNKFIRRIL